MDRYSTAAGALLAGALAALPGTVAAGAWTQAPGAGQVIASFGHKSPQLSPFSASGFEDDTNFVSLFLEYGVIEGLTVGGTAYIELDREASGGNTLDFGLFARQRLWQGGTGDVVSVQLGVKQPANDLLGGEFGGADADPTAEVSLRLLYGRGWGLDWGSAFVSLEGGYHLQTDGDDDEVRADVTVGAQPWDCCMILLSAFSTVVLGVPDEASLKLAPSFAWTFRPAGAGEDAAAARRRQITLQVGLTQDLLDLNDGLGFQIGVWKPF